MGGQVEVVAYGEPALAALDRAISLAKVGDRLAPVTVVCPTPRAASWLRKRLAAGTGYVNVRVCTLADVAASLAADGLRAAGRRPLTRAGLLAAIRVTVASASGNGRLARVASHASTTSEIAARYEELREGSTSADRLAGRPGVAGELAAIVADVRRLLAPASFDDVDLLDAASDVARRARVGRATSDLGVVILHLPEQLGPAALRLVGALGDAVPVVVHLGIVGDDEADGPIVDLCDRLVARGLAPPTTLAAPRVAIVGSGAFVGARVERVIVASDAAAEVRVAVRLVLEHLEAGGRADRCALLLASRGSYPGLVAGVLDTARIAWSGQSGRLVGETSSARLLSGLLQLAGGSDPVERQALVAWLGSAPVADRAGEPVSVGEWDRCSRLAGVVEAEPRAFAARLRRHAHEIEQANKRRDGRSTSASASAEAQATSEHDERADAKRDQRTLEACTSMAELLDDLAEVIDEARSLHTWRELASWSALALQRFLGPPPARASWTRRELAADAVVADLLADIGELDVLDPDPDVSRFAAAFTASCERYAPRPDAAPSGVVVGPLEAVAGCELDLVVVLGAVEGFLPGRVPASPLLNADDRQAAGLDARSARLVVQRDYRRLLVALAGARRRFATVPLRDSGTGRALRASRFLASAMAETALESTATSLVQGFDDVRSGRAPAIHRTELECALLGAPATNAWSSERRALERAAPVLAAGLTVVAARQARLFDRSSGRAVPTGAGETGGLIADRPLSPTSLETYASCPFRYFLVGPLSCEAIDAPELRIEIDARDRGSIVHEVLEKFVGELIAPGDRAAPSGARRGTAERLVQLAEATFSRYERLGLTGKAVLWELERRRLLGWLEAERVADQARRRAGWEPYAVEASFGFAGVPPVRRVVGDRQLSFRGRIDRMDRSGDGAVTVVDYKAAKPKYYDGLRDDCVDRGRHLQLPLYALAAAASVDAGTEIGAVFRFVGDVRTEIRFDLDASGVARLDEALGALVGAIDSGAFPYRPGPTGFGGYDNCKFCEFDTVCVPERSQVWESARTSADLASYVELVEPGATDGSDEESRG